MLINLTAYDGGLEKVAKKLSSTEGGVKFKTLSMSKTLTTAQYVEKSLAYQLLEDTKLKIYVVNQIMRDQKIMPIG